ncbi:MAG: hypothetical protein QM530_08100 [Phycisphaerales bacterium]|nr:hypothetical protein [Phycisphaerales bacterium]
MNKIKVLIISVVLMFLSNLFLMYWVWNSSHRPPHRSAGPRNEIIQQLRLDAEQVKKYDVLIQDHRLQIRTKDEEIGLLKKELYSTLNGGNEKNDSLIQLLADKQKEVEKINLKHFEDIGKLCRPEQQSAYKDLVVSLSDLFGHKRRPKH